MRDQALVLKKIRDNFRSFRDVQLFLHLHLFLLFISILLKIVSLKRLFVIMSYLSAKRNHSYYSNHKKDLTVHYTDMILRRGYWNKANRCLKRTLVLFHFLRKSGMDVHICFGVRYKEEKPAAEEKKKLEGHAWLLYRGEPFLENDREAIKTYTNTLRFPVTENKSSPLKVDRK